MTNQTPMEYIWDQIPKQADGSIRYLKHDLDYLYYHGFVHSRRFTLQQWKSAFAPYKQPDESYVLNKHHFLLLEPFRYAGMANEVFDPSKIKERAYTDAELRYLYDHAIHIASDVNIEAYWAYLNAFKTQGHVDAKGNLIIDNTVKTGLFILLEKFPSPRRRLEKEVLRIRSSRDAELQANQKHRDRSGFMVGQTGMETQQAALESLQSSTTKKSKQKMGDDDEKPAKDSIDIKKLRKPPKKFKG